MLHLFPCLCMSSEATQLLISLQKPVIRAKDLYVVLGCQALLNKGNRPS